MPYCPSCGSEIGVENDYCPSCGANILKFTEKKTIEFEAPEQIPKQILPALYQRNYLIWFLLSIATGIFSFIYLYFIFDDLNKLDFYPKPKGVPSTAIEQNKLVLYFVFYIALSVTIIGSFIMLYIIYSKKYSLLNNYLEAHPAKQSSHPITSKKYVGLMIVRDIFLLGFQIPIIFGTILPAYGFVMFGYSSSQIILFSILIIVAVLFIIISISISIYLIVQDFKWQEALNERIRILIPNAPMKELF